MLTCSSRVLSQVSVTSLLPGRDMPLQKLSGVAIFASLQECGFSRVQPYTEQPTLQNHGPKLGLRSTSSNATKQTLTIASE